MSEAFTVVTAERGVEELLLDSNGLRVLLVEEDSVPVVAACLVYHVGSRNEGVGHTGATHLLEHLMFKGSRRFDPADGRSVARSLERVGASFNATTWFDRTSYYETLPPEHLELALEIEADRMRHALLRGEDLASEMTVVRNELDRGENDPFDVLLKDSFAMAFREHPYHHPTIGWRSDVESISIDRLRHFYDTFYHPDNATLIVVGCFQRANVLDLVARHFGPLPRAAGPIPPVVTVEPPQEGERRFVVRRAGEVGSVVLSWRIPPALHQDTHALAVLAHALTGGVTSRLYQELVESGKCLSVQAIPWQLRDPGLFQVFAILNPPTTHGEAEASIRAALEGIARDGVHEEELERAKVQVEAEIAYQRDSPAQVAGSLAEAVASADWRFFLDYPQRTRAVDCEAVVAVARRYFSEDHLSVGYFVPRPGDEPVSTVTAGMPAPCHWRSRLAEGVREIALPGGARVLLMERHGNPTVHLQGSLLAGHGMVGPESWTVASLLPEMLERGTRGHDRMSLARAMEDRAIELDLSGESFNPLEVFVSGRCLARHLPLLLELLLEELRFPTFPADELNRVRQLRLGELTHSQEDTFLRAYEAFSRLAFPAGHPHCRREVSQRRDFLERVTREDLLAGHNLLYGPSSLILVLVGDVKEDDLRSRLCSLLEGWEGGRSEPIQRVRRMPRDVVAGEVFETMPDKPNLDLVLGHPGGLRRGDEDFLAAMIANSVLGHSTLSSRLGRSLRDREGLTYGVISRFFGASLLDGPWAVSCSVDRRGLERALELVRQEVTSFLAEGPTGDELDDERAAMAGAYRVSLATSAGMAREIARLARHGLPASELDELPERVLAIDREAVIEAARRHIVPDHFCVAAAGDLGKRGS